MEKVGIITFTYGDNIGQRLQNYAVQEIIRSFGYEALTIKQIRDKRLAIKVFFRSLQKRGKSAWIPIIKRSLRFAKFDKLNIAYYRKPISEATMSSFPEQEFSYFVAGSDQIWSPKSIDVNSTMFLTFTSKNKRIAFSPSLSVDRIEEKDAVKYKAYFNGFTNLSIREDTGARIIAEVSGKVAEVLPDPTLVADKCIWDNIEKKPDRKMPDRYALLYFLSESQRKEAVKICQEKKLAIVDIYREPKYLDFGPSEFLYCVKNADLVITDSYHGTIFSIIYHVPFVVCNRSSKTNMSSRFTTLFNTLEISGRMINEINIDTLFEFDFGKTDKNIKTGRKKAIRYLENSFIS